MIFTSEQVSAGHPDKICDQISDAIVTECLRQDKASRVAIEALIKGRSVVVAGEVTTTAKININALIQQAISRSGTEGWEEFVVTSLVSTQSPDIAQGVAIGGAGDQGMMFGYATDETPEMLPIPFVLATDVLIALRSLSHPYLKADAKSQVTYDYKKERIETFLVSSQHSDEVSSRDLYGIIAPIMRETAVSRGFNDDFKVLVNPTGRFVLGGPDADAGVTGRKIVADTYGGMCRHGGGAFSGKDPSKVDRSAAYMARQIARDVVTAGYSSKCEVQLSYAIGVAEPVSVRVDCLGTARAKPKDVIRAARKYDLTPKGIITELGLLEVDYNKVSAYGHFGKPLLPWEK